MSESLQENQNTPSAEDLAAQIAADEAAREAAADPEVIEPQPEETETEEPVKEPEESDFEKRISRMAYEKRTAEKQARELQAKLDRLEGRSPALPRDEEMQKLIEERATALAQMQAYNDKANAIYRAGVEAFPDFEAKLTHLREIGGVSPELVEAADEVGDPHKLIHYLARNIDEAERIVKLPPHRMGAALAKVAAKMAATPVQSKAPPPIKPLGGTVKAELNDETMPIDEYMKREDERMSQRRRR